MSIVVYSWCCIDEAKIDHEKPPLFHNNVVQLCLVPGRLRIEVEDEVAARTDIPRTIISIELRRVMLIGTFVVRVSG